MKQCPTSKKLLVIIVLFLLTTGLFISFSFRVQDDSPVIIHVEKAGTLPILIKSKNKYSIKDLTLSGNLNGTDITFIREMAGGGSLKSIKTEGKLTKLNLTNANIVAGGDKYFNEYQTRDNSITDYMFAELFRITTLVIPNSVTSICNGAFSGCFGLTTFTIPKNVTIIDDFAFTGCFGLTSMFIPNSITSIGDYVFTGCYGLTSITIPNSVTSIGEYIFTGCNGLISAIVSNNLTTISNYAFTGCSGLTSFNIPGSITSIGEYAFTGCTGLQKIYCNSTSSPQIIGTDTFKGIDNTICRLYVPNGTYDDYSNAEGWNYFKNIIEGK